METELKAEGSVVVSEELSSDPCLWIFGAVDISYADERESRSVFSVSLYVFADVMIQEISWL